MEIERTTNNNAGKENDETVSTRATAFVRNNRENYDSTEAYPYVWRRRGKVCVLGRVSSSISHTVNQML